MIPCINQATVIKADTIKFLGAARRHSFAHVELDIGKVEECIERDGLSSLKEAINDNGLTVVSLNAIENYPMLTEEETARSLERCKEIFNLSNELGCEIVVVNPSEFTDTTRDVMKARFDAFLLKTAEVARTHSVKLAFEYVSYDNRVVNTLGSSIKKLGIWGDDIGLVLDLFHLYRSGEGLDVIPESMFNRVWVFHVNDAPNIPIEKLVDFDRVFPFEGVANPEKCLSDLRNRGFKGPVSVELFNKQYWDMDEDQVIEKARQSLKKLNIA